MDFLAFMEVNLCLTLLRIDPDWCRSHVRSPTPGARGQGGRWVSETGEWSFVYVLSMLCRNGHGSSLIEEEAMLTMSAWLVSAQKLTNCWNTSSPRMPCYYGAFLSHAIATLNA